MYYYGYFRNNDTSKDEDGQLYKVIIITNFRENETTVGGELVLTDSPFTVEYSSEENQLQKPYKCSTATVGILQGDINYSFFDSSGNNVLVQLLKWRNDNIYIEDFGWVGTKNQSVIIPNYDSANADTFLFDVEWSGFATPNAYSQNYEAINDEFELECQDALSTLKYKNYEKVADFCSFSDILKKYVLQLGVYKNIYITDSVKIATSDVQDILHATYVDERNFFDEDGEPMKVMEVIEEIMKFYSLTIIPFRDSLYVVNYDGIKNENNDYFCISYPSINNYFKNCVIANFTTKVGKVTLSDNKEILADDFTENGTSVTIESTFNKVTVTNDSYPVESLLPSLDETDIRRSDYPLTGDFTEYWLEKDLQNTTNTNKVKYKSKNLNILENYRDQSNYNYKKVYIRYSDFPFADENADKSIEPFWYQKDTSEGVPYTNDIKDTLIRHDGKTDIQLETCLNNIGCCVCEYQVTDIGNFTTDKVNQLNFEKAIMISQPTPTNLNSSREGWNPSSYLPYISGGQPLFKVTYKNIQSSATNFIKIDGNMKFFMNPDILPVEFDYDRREKADDCFVWCEMYLKGKNKTYALHTNTISQLPLTEELEWEELEEGVLSERFKLPLEYKRDEDVSTNTLKIVSNSQCLNLSTEQEIQKLMLGDGFIVQMPTNETGEIKSEVYTLEFIMCRPFVPSKTHLYARCTLLKDFDISIVNNKSVDMIGNDDANEDNIEFTNIADSVSVDDYDDVELKFSSWCKQPCNFNSLLYSNNFSEQGYIRESGDLNRLTTIYNKGMGTLVRPEETIIETVINQYKTPTTAIEVNLKESNDYMPFSTLNYHFFDGKTFVVDSMGINYRYNTNSLRIVEKK